MPGLHGTLQTPLKNWHGLFFLISPASSAQHTTVPTAFLP